MFYKNKLDEHNWKIARIKAEIFSTARAIHSYLIRY